MSLSLLPLKSLTSFSKTWNVISQLIITVWIKKTTWTHFSLFNYLATTHNRLQTTCETKTSVQFPLMRIKRHIKYCLLGFYNMQSGRNLWIFQKTLVIPASEHKNILHKIMKEHTGYWGKQHMELQSNQVHNMSTLLQ